MAHRHFKKGETSGIATASLGLMHEAYFPAKASFLQRWGEMGNSISDPITVYRTPFVTQEFHANQQNRMHDGRVNQMESRSDVEVR